MMIELTKDAETRNTMILKFVANIITRYAQASVEQKIAGERWYETANQIAQMISGGNVTVGAGVLAALSANKSWTENLKIARLAFETGTPAKHVKVQLAKAQAIMEGAEPTSVLGNGLKTQNFYQCIVDPTNTTAVCIDRHAHDVAVGEVYGNDDRGLSTATRYNMLAEAYRIAAEKLNTLPMIVQAVTWVVQVENYSQWNARETSNGHAER
jgi:hypothetical protein